MTFLREYLRLRRARKDSDDVKANLSRLLWRSNTIAAWFSFWFVVQWSLEFPEFLTQFNVFKLELDPEIMLGTGKGIFQAVEQLVREKWPYLILAYATYKWYTNYRNAVGNEIEFAEEIFHRSVRPKDWNKVSNRALLSALSVLMVVTFLLLAAMLQHLPIFCCIVLALWCQDMLGNASVNRNLKRYLDDETYHLPKDHIDRPFFERKAQIAREYWLERPQLERIAIQIFLTSVVLMISLSEPIFGVALHPIFATGLMSAIIFGNELTMKRWRITRDADMLEATAAHSKLMEAEETDQGGGENQSGAEDGQADGSDPGSDEAPLDNGDGEV